MGKVIHGFKEDTYRAFKYVRNGKAMIDIECPFCGKIITAYIWSFSAVGKKCICGAKHLYIPAVSRQLIIGEK